MSALSEFGCGRTERNRVPVTASVEPLRNISVFPTVFETSENATHCGAVPEVPVKVRISGTVLVVKRVDWTTSTCFWSTMRAAEVILVVEANC
jgi:hypothetical protein